MDDEAWELDPDYPVGQCADCGTGLSIEDADFHGGLCPGCWLRRRRGDEDDEGGVAGWDLLEDGDVP